MHQLKKLHPVHNAPIFAESVKGEMYQLQSIIWIYQYLKLVFIDYE